MQGSSFNMRTSFPPDVLTPYARKSFQMCRVYLVQADMPPVLGWLVAEISRSIWLEANLETARLSHDV